jgi:hypothetical protein
MTTPQQRKQGDSARAPQHKSRMLAGRDEPWVAVSTIKEKMFCDRAAIIASEKIQDEGEEGMIALGQYRVTALYTLGAIRRAIQGRLWWLLGCVVVFFGSAMQFNSTSGLVSAAATLLLWLLSALKGLQTLYQLLRLFGQFVRAKSAASRVPDFRNGEVQDVYWWGVVNSGFEVKQPHEALRDDKWQLVGKPWRILQKHDVRIPVVRVRMENPRIVRQHFARAAAYCHLLERNEPGVSSPGGIILFSPGYAGKFLPNNHRSASTFHNALLDARALLARVQRDGWEPQEPESKRCSGCPFGRPRSLDGGDSYQSECGERFHWVPPHARAYEKGLL